MHDDEPDGYRDAEHDPGPAASECEQGGQEQRHAHDHLEDAAPLGPVGLEMAEQDVPAEQQEQEDREMEPDRVGGPQTAPSASSSKTSSNEFPAAAQL